MEDIGLACWCEGDTAFSSLVGDATVFFFLLWFLFSSPDDEEDEEEEDEDEEDRGDI